MLMAQQFGIGHDPPGIKSLWLLQVECRVEVFFGGVVVIYLHKELCQLKIFAGYMFGETSIFGHLYTTAIGFECFFIVTTFPVGAADKGKVLDDAGDVTCFLCIVLAPLKIMDGFFKPALGEDGKSQGIISQGDMILVGGTAKPVQGFLCLALAENEI